MMRFLACIGVGSSLICAAIAEWVSPHPLEWETQASCSLIPFPQKVQWEAGELKLPRVEGWKLKTSCKGEKIRVAWSSLLRDVTAAKRANGDQPITVNLTLNKQALPEEQAAEGYKLEIQAGGVSIKAVTEAGLFNGLQTLRQMVMTGRKGLPFCSITDYPAFSMRGFLLDCGRNFQTVESLKAQLDLAANLKVNYFQWHMTDHHGWRVQSKAFPVLNQPKFRARDHRDTYSYKEIRELFEYARARNITIIPELDMPGHSTCFQKAMGFTMHSPQGMDALEKIIREFCAEVPAELSPYLHIGADEVRIPNAHEFVKRMSDLIISLGRRPAQWAGPRDLPVGKDSIAQRWGEGGEMVEKSLQPETIVCPSYDSAIGYTNLFDPALLVRRWFFMRPCGVGQGDDQKLGAIICTWPDARVDDKAKIPLHSAQWPGMCAMAERAWVGGNADGDKLTSSLPKPDTEAFKAYASFEKRMMGLGRTLFRKVPFPHWAETGVYWQVVNPVPKDQVETVRQQVLKGDMKGLDIREAYGANLYFRTKPSTGFLGMFSGTQPGATAWAVTTIHVPKAGKYPFMIGFDAPARSSRRYSGVPAAGQWSQCGTRIWLNGLEEKNPRTYKLAGQRRSERDTWTTWDSGGNELPFDDEEIWWAQKPTMLNLKKGDNTIVIEQPYIGIFQSWGVSFTPLFRPYQR